MATLPTWGAVPLAQGMAKSLAETGIRAAGSTTVVGSLSSLMPEWLASSMASGENWLLMGRGDPKTKKGKIFRKSNGKARPTMKKRRKDSEKVAPSVAPPLPEEFRRPFGDTA